MRLIKPQSSLAAGRLRWRAMVVCSAIVAASLFVRAARAGSALGDSAAIPFDSRAQSAPEAFSAAFTFDSRAKAGEGISAAFAFNSQSAPSLVASYGYSEAFQFDTSPALVAEVVGREGRRFDVLRDAYSFPNFDSSHWSIPYASQIMRDLTAMHPGYNLPPAYQFELFFGYLGGWYGYCYGMSGSSLRYFLDASLKPDAVALMETHDMPYATTAVIAEIVRIHASQTLNIIISKITQRDNISAKESYAQIEASIRGGEVPVITMWEMRDGVRVKGGHAVALISIERSGASRLLNVYDPNHPNTRSRIVYDSQSETYDVYPIGNYRFNRFYAVSQGASVNDDFPFYLNRLSSMFYQAQKSLGRSVLMASPVAPGSVSGSGLAEKLVPSDSPPPVNVGDYWVKDDQGRCTGIINGRGVNQIPDVTQSTLGGSWRVEAPEGLHLVVHAGKGNGSSYSIYAYDAAGGQALGESIAFNGVVLDPNDCIEFEIGSGGGAIVGPGFIDRNGDGIADETVDPAAIAVRNMGDLNGDGVTDVADLVAASAYLANPYALSPDAGAAGDVDLNGIINSADLDLINRIILNPDAYSGLGG